MSEDNWTDDRDTWEDQPDPWDAYEESQKVTGQNEWTDWQQRGYDTPGGQGDVAEQPHSGLGIASVVLTIVAGLGIVVTLIGTMFVVIENPNLAEDDPQILAIGGGIILSLLMSALGGLLGLIGLFQPDRRKLFAILGCVFATLEWGGVIGLMVIGLAFG